MIKEPRAQPAAARRWQDRDPEFGGQPVCVEGEVSQGHDANAAIEDAKQLVACEVHLFDVATQLLVVGDIPEARQSVALDCVEVYCSAFPEFGWGKRPAARWVCAVKARAAGNAPRGRPP